MIKVYCRCGKRAFPTRETAIVSMKMNGCVAVYRCRRNGVWHMTTHPIKPVVKRNKTGGWVLFKANGPKSHYDTFEEAVKAAAKFNRRVIGDPKLRVEISKRLIQGGMTAQAINLMGK